MEEPEVPPLKVSVIIVSCNRAGALRRCLQALEASIDREQMEIVVVDNGSFDESPTMDQEFPSAIFLRLERNFGFVKAANIGMRTAKADFYFFLDAGVEVRPETVSQLAAKLEASSEAVAVCPLLETEGGETATTVYRLPNAATVWGVARIGAYTPAPLPEGGEAAAVELHGLDAFLCRAYFLKGLRYIDQHYAQAWADAELCAQIRRASRKVLLAPGVRAVWHAGEEPELAPRARGLLAADWLLGAARYAGKHFGLVAGIKLRVLASLWCLGQMLAFRDPGFRFGRFLNVVTGQKIDGTQTAL